MRKMSFTQWLLKSLWKDNLPIANLAGYVAYDPDWPKCRSVLGFSMYIVKLDKPVEYRQSLLNAVGDAWELYESYKREARERSEG